jgi:selenide,water dikinase
VASGTSRRRYPRLVREDVRLTTFSHGAGCACKLGPSHLDQVLGWLEAPVMPREVLVSAETGDDAAVYLLPDGRGLVATVDFFTPIVDDAYDWGRIAAANALSDVYAMGGSPVMALNLTSWPVDDLPLELLARVMQGGQDVAQQAGVAVVGGHSITDPEPKYGMVAMGFVPVERIVRNSTAPAGAALFMTKPLGLGIITTAIKRQVATELQVKAAVEVMTTLNADASAAMVEGDARAATDVTGFGFLGHLQRMLVASGVAGSVFAGAVPVLPEVLHLAAADVVPSGTRRNHAYLQPFVDWGELTEPEQLILADAQTSGGLLIVAADPEDMRLRLVARGVQAVEVGLTEQGEPGHITVEGRLTPD